MKRPFAELWGTGSYAPPRVMTNDEFSKILDTSDQWIQERTGIQTAPGHKWLLDVVNGVDSPAVHEEVWR